MITRKWTAPIPIFKRDEYIDYIMQTGFAEYKNIEGNIGAFLTLEEKGNKLYFTALTFWDSYESIKSFAGEKYQLAKYYPKDDEFLLEKPKYVEHQEVVYGTSNEIRIAT
jgi:heme-degrading monooxygenase HmoA